MAAREKRSRTVGCKVSEGEYARLEAQAHEHNQTLTEWCREVFLDGVRTPRATPAEKTILAEVVGLRTTLLNLFYLARRVLWRRCMFPPQQSHLPVMATPCGSTRGPNGGDNDYEYPAITGRRILYMGKLNGLDFAGSSFNRP